MLTKSLHPSDQDLLLLSDGELPGRRAVRIGRHLAGCWSCRTRAAKIEATIGELMAIRWQASQSRFPPIDGPRALLKARLAVAPDGTVKAESTRCRWLADMRMVALIGSGHRGNADPLRDAR
jgi:anti-sigma factor RsiW